VVKVNNEVKNQMESAMEQEYAEAVAMLEKANSAFQRLFGTQEGEGEDD
jgi:hypothetical protein